MKKTKSLKNASNTEGVQIVNNNAPIQQQINIQNLHGTISDIQSPDTEPITTSISLIKKAVAQSETDKALKLLLALLETHDKDKIDDAVLIKSRWEHLKKEKYRGVIDEDSYGKEKNRINASLLMFLKQLLP